MAYEVINTQRSTSIIRVVDVGAATIALTDLSANANETVSAANIKRVTWSTNGNITIVRNSVPMLTLHNAGSMLLDDFNYSIANNANQSIVVTVTTGGSLVMEVSKTATYTTGATGY
jgi:hypothetical protein